jgi:hypothetical protein
MPRPIPAAPSTLAAALAIALTLAACANVAEPTAPRATMPSRVIADAAYGGGDPRFYWLPPTVRSTPAYHGTFASGLSPTVTVCAGAVDACAQTVAHFTKAEGTGGARIAENTTSPSYRVTWLSSKCDVSAYCPLVPGNVYRMTVRNGATPLGYADIKIYRNLIEQNQDPTVGSYVPLLQSRPIGIAFRIEKP